MCIPHMIKGKKLGLEEKRDLEFRPAFGLTTPNSAQCSLFVLSKCHRHRHHHPGTVAPKTAMILFRSEIWGTVNELWSCSDFC